MFSFSRRGKHWVDERTPACRRIEPPAAAPGGPRWGSGMSMTVERELKFAGDVELDRLGGEQIEPHVFVSGYHDAADLRLLRAGITLRRRVENGVSRWQLKLPNGESRLELEEAGGPAILPPLLARVLSG